MSSESDSAFITVREGLELALAAGFKVTRPTVLRIFKDSGAVTRLGGRFFMPREKYIELLQRGDDDAANQEQPGTAGRGDSEAPGEAQS